MSSPPSRVKPSQRERKRYVLAKVNTDGHLPPDFEERLRDEIRERLGLLDAAKATVLISYTWHDTSHTILRVAHDYADKLIDITTSLDELGSTPVTITTETTSGTIKQIKNRYDTKHEQ